MEMHGIQMCLRKNAGDACGDGDIGKTSMYTRLDGYDVFRNSAQRQTDNGRVCSERNAWGRQQGKSNTWAERHETRVCNQTLRLWMDARIGNRIVKHKMR